MVPKLFGPDAADHSIGSILEIDINVFKHTQGTTLRLLNSILNAYTYIKGSSYILLWCRWSRDLMNTCTDYLATADGPSATDRLHILKVNVTSIIRVKVPLSDVVDMIVRHKI